MPLPIPVRIFVPMVVLTYVTITVQALLSIPVTIIMPKLVVILVTIFVLLSM
jgi:hypothetical protein